MPAMSASEARRRAPACLVLALTVALAACEGGQAEGDTASASASTAQAAGTSPAAASPEARASSDKAVAASGAPAAARFGDRQLDHPDDLQILMLAYRLEGRTPPIDEWAAAQSRVAYADEFKRPALLKEEQERLQGIYDGTADVGRLRMNVNARFGEYDASRGGYYLDAFMPGSAFNFSVQPSPSAGTQQISLQVDNPEELNFWPLDATAAQDVLTRNSGMRSVVLDSRFVITGISRRNDGRVISARLAGYAIGSDHYNRPATFGELRFDAGGEH
ncbi:hypothetical protein [Pseudoxanthomonas sp. LH2527]|uniref:hypothetical protein n=1 Tax=Pseudoxanthomonas sp. LH2527 TaxID=2923249 RepID=UPI001F12B89C|nr:hypothetical protein [Pseudoxanthomonas sp. LH2527]